MLLFRKLVSARYALNDIEDKTPMRLLITSGPTREYIDPVRFISNGSSGRMGAALALAAIKRGVTPVVVSGPVNVTYDSAVEVHHVTTTEDMLKTSLELFPECIGVIGAAAPCDYRPEVVAPEKLAKKLSPNGMAIKFIETEDILAHLGYIKRTDQWIFGFALETNDGKNRAIEKLRRKNCNFIALNSPDSIDNERARLEIFDTGGSLIGKFEGEKNEIAEKILTLVLCYTAKRQ